VEQPNSDDPIVDATTIRTAHRSYLTRYPSLDAMDALHIVFGTLLGTTHFITFDNGWLPVSQITVIQ